MAPLSEEMASGGLAHHNPTLLGPTTPTVATMPLRRAIYVRVADLVRSFDIDAEKFRAEMAKLDAEKREKKEQHAKEDAAAAADAQMNKNPAEKTDRKDERETEEDEAAAAASSLAAISLGDAGAKMAPTSEGQFPTQKQFPQRLIPPSGGSNLCLLVGKVDVVVDKLRVDRSRVRLAEVEVGDETGTVSLRARDDQIDVLKEISEHSGAVVLRNCTMELYQGKHLRLAVTKWGKLSSYPDQVPSTPPPPLQINKELNYSAVDLNLVVGEMKSPPTEDSSSSSSGRNRIPPPSVEGPIRDVGLDEVARSAGGATPKQKRRGRDRKQQFRPGAQGPPGHGPTYLPYPGMVPGVGSFPPVYPSSGSVTDAGPYGYHIPPHLRDHGGEGHRHHQHHHGISAQHRDHQQKQQHLLLQQYELQQRHLEQMQLFQQQQERQRRMFESHGQQLSHPSPVFMPDILRVGSMEGSTSQVVLPPMGGGPGVASARDYHHSSPQHSTVPLHQRGAAGSEGHMVGDHKVGHGGGSRVPGSRGFGMGPYEEQFPPIQLPQQRRAGSRHEQQPSPSSFPRMETPPASPGRMNPQAATFAPSHGKAQAGPVHLSHQQVPPSLQYPYLPYETVPPAQSGATAGYGGSSVPPHQQQQQHAAAVFAQAGAAGGLYSPGFHVPDMDDSGHGQEPGGGAGGGGDRGRHHPHPHSHQHPRHHQRHAAPSSSPVEASGGAGMVPAPPSSGGDERDGVAAKGKATTGGATARGGGVGPE